MGKSDNSSVKSLCEPGEKIHIHKSWCKACGICVEFCPRNALATDEYGYPYMEDPEKCNLCGICEMFCPDFAIDLCYPDNDKEKKKEKKKGKKKKKDKKEEAKSKE